MDPEPLGRVTATVSTLRQSLDDLRRADRAHRVQYEGWARRDAELAAITADYRALRSQLQAPPGAAGRVDLGPPPEVRPAPDAVGAELGGVVPAMALAAAYLADRPGPDEYVAAYRAAAPRLWEVGVAAGCPEPVARAALLCMERLDDAERQLVALCAFLDGHDRLPVVRLLAAAGLLPEPLRSSVDPVAAPVRLGLLKPKGTTVRLHPRVRLAVQYWQQAAADRWRELAALLVLTALRGAGDDEVPLLLVQLQPAKLNRPALAILAAERLAEHEFARGAYAAARDAAEAALELRQRHLPPDLDESGDLLDLFVRAQEHVGDPDGVRAAMDRKLRAVLARRGSTSMEYARELVDAAATLRGLGDLPAARDALQRALETSDAVGSHMSEETFAALGEVQAELGDPAGALATYRTMLARLQRRLGPDDRYLFAAFEPLSALLLAQGDRPAAREVLERALQTLDASFDGDRPPAWLGRALITAAGAPARPGLVDRLLRVYLPHVGFAGPDLPAVLDDLVDALLDRDEPALARAVLERVVAAKAEVRDNSYGPTHRQVFASLDRLADVCERQPDIRGVVDALRRLVEAMRSLLGDGHEDLAPVLMRLAAAIERTGDHDEALRTYGRAMTAVQRYRGRDHVRTAAIATDIGVAVHRTGDLGRAKLLLEAAVSFNSHAAGPTAEETARALAAYVEVLEALGEPADEPRARLARAGRLPEEPDEVPIDRLPAVAARWTALADERSRSPEEELNALGRAAAMWRRWFATRRDDDLRTPTLQDPTRAFATVTGRQQRLLRAAGRGEEAGELHDEMLALHRRGNSWFTEGMRKVDAQAAEMAVRAEATQRRFEVTGQLLHHRPTPQRLAAIHRRMAGETADPVAVDDAPARLATATPAVRDLVELCAFLDPAVPLPLDRLTAAVGLLPTALRRAADDDAGLGAVLDAARERQLLAGAGVAARMHPQVSAAIRAELTPDNAAEAWLRAAMLVLAAPAPLPVTADDDDDEPLPEPPPDHLPRHARYLAEQHATGRDVLVEMLREQS